MSDADSEWPLEKYSGVSKCIVLHLHMTFVLLSHKAQFTLVKDNSVPQCDLIPMWSDTCT